MATISKGPVANLSNLALFIANDVRSAMTASLVTAAADTWFHHLALEAGEAIPHHPANNIAVAPPRACHRRAITSSDMPASSPRMTRRWLPAPFRFGSDSSWNASCAITLAIAAEANVLQLFTVGCVGTWERTVGLLSRGLVMRAGGGNVCQLGTVVEADGCAHVPTCALALLARITKLFRHLSTAASGSQATAGKQDNRNRSSHGSLHAGGRVSLRQRRVNEQPDEQLAASAVAGQTPPAGWPAVAARPRAAHAPRARARQAALCVARRIHPPRRHPGRGRGHRGQGSAPSLHPTSPHRPRAGRAPPRRPRPHRAQTRVQ